MRARFCGGRRSALSVRWGQMQSALLPAWRVPFGSPCLVAYSPRWGVKLPDRPPLSFSPPPEGDGGSPGQGHQGAAPRGDCSAQRPMRSGSVRGSAGLDWAGTRASAAVLKGQLPDGCRAALGRAQVLLAGFARRGRRVRALVSLRPALRSLLWEGGWRWQPSRGALPRSGPGGGGGRSGRGAERLARPGRPGTERPLPPPPPPHRCCLRAAVLLPARSLVRAVRVQPAALRTRAHGARSRTRPRREAPRWVLKSPDSAPPS